MHANGEEAPDGRAPRRYISARFHHVDRPTIGADGHGAPPGASLGVERYGPARTQAADLRRRRDRRRARHPACRGSHTRSPPSAVVPRARDRRAAPRCALSRARHRAAARQRRTRERPLQRQPPARRPRARRREHRRRGRRTASRLPARGGEVGRRPLRRLSRAGGRRPDDARHLRRDPARRGLSHELHLHAAGAHLAPLLSPAGLAGARLARVESRAPPGGRRRRADGSRVPDGSLLRADAALRLAGAPGREARAAGLGTGLRPRRCPAHEPVPT